MKRAGFVLAALLIGIPLQSQAKESSWHKLSIEGINGYYKLPGMLLDMDKSIVEHPNYLVGEISGIRGTYAINDFWSVGGTWLRISANGYGAWARSDTAETLAANGVTGIVYGKTDIELRGVVLEVERRFWRNKALLGPYIRGGLGAGELTVDFRGKFTGHETVSGFNFPVEEDARDKVKKTIPLVSLEAGLRFLLAKNVTVTLAGYWNTGCGGLLGAGWRF